MSHLNIYKSKMRLHDDNNTDMTHSIKRTFRITIDKFAPCRLTLLDYLRMTKSRWINYGFFFYNISRNKTIHPSIFSFSLLKNAYAIVNKYAYIHICINNYLLFRLHLYCHFIDERKTITFIYYLLFYSIIYVETIHKHLAL